MITYRALGQRGRLGNQLWQVASTIGLGHKYEQEVKLPRSWIYRYYFSLPEEMYVEDKDIPISAMEAPQFLPDMDPRCVDYMQDINIFLPYLDEIREYLAPSPKARMSIPHHGLLDTIAIHVRRGDNVSDPGLVGFNKNDFHLCPGLSYYQQGLAEYPDVPYVVVVSDDYQWCRANIPADYYGKADGYLKEHEEGYGKVVPWDWQDLFLLTTCDYFVVGGSTFGIWGALLSNCDPDHVVRPDHVYGPKLSYINSDLLFHPDWRVIPHAD